MPRKRESAQLLQQLDARNPLRGAPQSTLIVTCLTRVLQTLIGTAQVAAFGVIIWIGCGGLEWIYHKYPLPTVSVMFFALTALVSVEVIRWRGER